MRQLFWFEDPISETFFAKGNWGESFSSTQLCKVVHEERLSTVRSWLAEDKKKQALRYLYTIDQLRSALVLTIEDAEFCFSHLPKTPKIQSIKELFFHYLTSSLQEDSAKSLWKMIERIKQGEEFLKEYDKIVFIPKVSPSFLFSSLVQSFGARAEMKTESTLFPLKGLERKAPLFRGTAAQCSIALVDHIRRLIDRSTTSKNILIFFSGTPETRQFLDCYLNHKKIFDIPVIPFESTILLPDTYVFGLLEEAEEKLSLLTHYESETLKNAGFATATFNSRQLLDRLRSRNAFRRLLFFTGKGGKDLRIRDSLKAAKPSESVKLPIRPNLSATALETYMRCPAQYFYSRTMRLRKDSPELQLPLYFGQITHKALEKTFLVWDRVSLDSLTSILWNAFEESKKEIFTNLKPPISMLRLLREQFKEVVVQVPKMEKRLSDIFGSTATVSLEKDFSYAINGLTLTGKIDRVERTASGKLLVLDYKTGRVNFSPEQVERGVHFQALFYLLAVAAEFSQDLVGILFYDLKEGELKRGILFEDSVPKDHKKLFTRGHIVTKERFESLRTTCLENIRSIQERLKQNDFAPTPSATQCVTCDFASFCRVGFGYA